MHRHRTRAFGDRRRTGSDLTESGARAPHEPARSFTCPVRIDRSIERRALGRRVRGRFARDIRNHDSRPEHVHHTIERTATIAHEHTMGDRINRHTMQLAKASQGRFGARQATKIDPRRGELVDITAGGVRYIYVTVRAIDAHATDVFKQTARSSRQLPHEHIFIQHTRFKNINHILIVEDQHITLGFIHNDAAGAKEMFTRRRTGQLGNVFLLTARFRLENVHRRGAPVHNIHVPRRPVAQARRVIRRDVKGTETTARRIGPRPSRQEGTRRAEHSHAT